MQDGPGAGVVSHPCTVTVAGALSSESLVMLEAVTAAVSARVPSVVGVTVMVTVAVAPPPA